MVNKEDLRALSTVLVTVGRALSVLVSYLYNVIF